MPASDITAAERTNTPSTTAPRPADLRTVELTYWQSVAASDDTTQLNAYLSRYPTGEFADLARAKIASLERNAKSKLTNSSIETWEIVNTCPHSNAWYNPATVNHYIIQIVAAGDNRTYSARFNGVGTDNDGRWTASTTYNTEGSIQINTSHPYTLHASRQELIFQGQKQQNDSISGN